MNITCAFEHFIIVSIGWSLLCQIGALGWNYCLDSTYTFWFLNKFFHFFSSSFYVYTCVVSMRVLYACQCVCVCLKLSLGSVFHYCSPPYILRKGLLLNLKLMDLVSLPIWLALDIPCFHLPSEAMCKPPSPVWHLCEYLESKLSSSYLCAKSFIHQVSHSPIPYSSFFVISVVCVFWCQPEFRVGTLNCCLSCTGATWSLLSYLSILIQNLI